MTRVLFLFLIPLLFLVSCRKTEQSDMIVSMQMLDRNGFSETISSKDRLNVYQNVDFQSAQPYEKVLRVYGKNGEGKSPSKLSSYHSNGGVWQYLEAVDGRAHGRYLEWYENGKMKIAAHVIEGLADLNEAAQTSWLFDKECTVWDQQGNLTAEFLYDKGLLVGETKYYFPNGAIQKIIPYTLGLVHGTLRIFDEEDNILEEIGFKNGKRDGAATALWAPGISKSQEQYREDLLFNGIYFDQEGNVMSEIAEGQGIRSDFKEGKLHSLIQYQGGVPEGEAQIFDPTGKLHISYQIKEEKKTGEEWEYYLNAEHTPKLFINWFEDQVQGMVKTWYSNGKLESQREMSSNKKHGLSFGYYKSGDLMLMEEYENDQLLKGSYYKKGEPNPISTIENGEGIVTLYNAEGHFTKKVIYERGKPIAD